MDSSSGRVDAVFFLIFVILRCFLESQQETNVSGISQLSLKSQTKV